MQATTLRQSQVTGFFSLPSASLAEHNPDAYNAAMAGAPKGSGSCAYCGTGIRHHVVVLTPEGATCFIGTDCAQKIGGHVAECVYHGRTTVAQTAFELSRNEQNAKWLAERAAHEAVRAQRREQFVDVLVILRAQKTEFHASLASQLEDGPLSWRQSNYVLKVVFGRRNKRNSAAYDTLADTLEGNI